MSPVMAGVLHVQLRRTLFKRSSIWLLALCGQSLARGLAPQLHRVPAEEGHLVVAAPRLAAVQALIAAGIIALPPACKDAGDPQSEASAATRLRPAFWVWGSWQTGLGVRPQRRWRPGRW